MIEHFFDWIQKVSIWGIILMCGRFWDAWKYFLLGQKIRKLRTAKGQSRDFGNTALAVDFIILAYFIFHNFDIYMILTTTFSIFCVVFFWIMVYLYYPYQHYPRKIKQRRPNLWIYFINSLENDRTKRHL